MSEYSWEDLCQKYIQGIRAGGDHSRERFLQSCGLPTAPKHLKQFSRALAPYRTVLKEAKALGKDERDKTATLALEYKAGMEEESASRSSSYQQCNHDLSNKQHYSYYQHPAPNQLYPCRMQMHLHHYQIPLTPSYNDPPSRHNISNSPTEPAHAEAVTRNTITIDAPAIDSPDHSVPSIGTDCPDDVANPATNDSNVSSPVAAPPLKAAPTQRRESKRKRMPSRKVVENQMTILKKDHQASTCNSKPNNTTWKQKSKANDNEKSNNKRAMQSNNDNNHCRKSGEKTPESDNSEKSGKTSQQPPPAMGDTTRFRCHHPLDPGE